jgi:ribosome biogenesis protein Nip4
METFQLYPFQTWAGGNGTCAISRRGGNTICYFTSFCTINFWISTNGLAQHLYLQIKKGYNGNYIQFTGAVINVTINKMHGKQTIMKLY